MNQQSINPDEVYRAKEMFETVLKNYNDNVDNLINVISLMKSRILELEGGTAKKEKTKE